MSGSPLTTYAAANTPGAMGAARSRPVSPQANGAPNAMIKIAGARCPHLIIGRQDPDREAQLTLCSKVRSVGLALA